MYCTSKAFLHKMHAHITRIEAESKGILSFEEYIPLPHFGHTILRFNIDQETYTLDDLDAYEALMQDVVQDEFLVDFMGSAYQKVGLEPALFDEKFRKCHEKYKDVTVSAGADRARLQADAAELLRQCGLPARARVWEIQMEAEETLLLLLGEEERKIGSYAIDDKAVHVYEVEEKPCVGLLRACMAAKEQRISLVRALLEA